MRPTDRTQNHKSRRHAGQALPEYGLIIALMAIVLFVMFQLLGSEIELFLQNFAAQYTAVTSG